VINPAGGCLAVLKRTRIGRIVRAWRLKRLQCAELGRWESRGRPVPPPHLVKQVVLQNYAANYGIRTFVETGTYFGEMVGAMKIR
jgi:non-ribosomal peptide synthetase component F